MKFKTKICYWISSKEESKYFINDEIGAELKLNGDAVIAIDNELVRVKQY